MVSKRLLLIAALLALLAGVSFGSYAMFLAQKSVRVTIDLSKSIVDANAALLGFLGIITVFVYNTYHEESRWAEEKMIDLKDDYEDYFDAQSMAAGLSTEAKEAILQKKYETYKSEKQKFEDRHASLRQSSRESFMQTIYSAVFLVASMFLAFLAMAEVDSSVRVFATLFAVTSMALGIIFLFFMIWLLKENLK